MLPAADDGAGLGRRSCAPPLEALLAGLAAHPAVADLVKKRILLNDPGREIAERILRLLRDGGCSAEQASQLGMYALLFMTSLVAERARARRRHDRRRSASRRCAPSGPRCRRCRPSGSRRSSTPRPRLTDCAASEQWLGFGIDTLMAGIRGQAPGA